jgi:hypothetical protein
MSSTAAEPNPPSPAAVPAPPLAADSPEAVVELAGYKHRIGRPS